MHPVDRLATPQRLGRQTAGFPKQNVTIEQNETRKGTRDVTSSCVKVRIAVLGGTYA